MKSSCSQKIGFRVGLLKYCLLHTQKGIG